MTPDSRKELVERVIEACATLAEEMAQSNSGQSHLMAERIAYQLRNHLDRSQFSEPAPPAAGTPSLRTLEHRLAAHLKQPGTFITEHEQRFILDMRAAARNHVGYGWMQQVIEWEWQSQGLAAWGPEYYERELAAAQKQSEFMKQLEAAESRLLEAEQCKQRLIDAFAHWHVNAGDGTDRCKACGLDLRNEIHSTTSYEAAKARKNAALAQSGGTEKS